MSISVGHLTNTKVGITMLGLKANGAEEVYPQKQNYEADMHRGYLSRETS